MNDSPPGRISTIASTVETTTRKWKMKNKEKGGGGREAVHVVLLPLGIVFQEFILLVLGPLL